MTRGQKIGAVTGAVVVVLVVAVVLFFALFNWNLLRPTINQKVSAALNRPFAIRGDLALAWGAPPGATGIARWIPSPHLSAENVMLGNPDFIHDRTMAHLQRLDVWLAPLGLLAHTVDIPRIAVARPAASLVRLADGRNNWTFDLGASKSDGKQPSSWTIDIGEIHFDQGTIKLDDAKLDANLTLKVHPLGKAVPFDQLAGKSQKGQGDLGTHAGKPGDFVFGWSIDGHYKGAPLSGSGKVGGMLAMDSDDHPFPVTADVRSGSTRVQIAGSIIKPMNFGGAELDVAFSGTSLDTLHRLTGITLPATPAYDTDGHLSVRFNGKKGSRFAYQHFNGHIGKSDIHGTLTYLLGKPRPKLTGDVVSNQLRVQDLAPLVGGDSKEHQKARGATTIQPKDKVLPVAPFKTAQWKTMDANVKFTARKVVQQKGLPLNDIYTHVVMDDGDILLDPLRFGFGGGNINTTLRLDGSKEPMAARIDLHARGLELDKIMPKVDALHGSLGHINGDATLSGSGKSVAALLADSNGRLTLLIDNGEISRNLMELAGLNVGNYIVGKLFGDKPTRINCAAADIPIDNGVAKPNVLVFDTKDAVINVTGDTSFKTEKLDFTITPRSKGIRIFTLRTPLTLHGTYANPSPGVKAAPLIERGVAAVVLGVVGTPAASLLALISPTTAKQNQCAPVIQEIKEADKKSDK